MRKTFIQKFNDCSLFSKISIIIWGLSLMITVVTLATAVIYYGRISQRAILANARAVTRNAEQTVNVNYTDILQRFVSVCGTRDFSSSLQEFTDPDATMSMRKSAVQEVLAALANCHYMVNSAIAVSGDGQQYYSLYSAPLRSDLLPLLSAEELETAEGITWFSERQSPFFSAEMVIPVLFPVYIKDSNYVRIPSSPARPDAYIILLLDGPLLSYRLVDSDESDFTSNFLFAAPDGRILSFCSPDAEELLYQEDMADFIRGFSEGSDKEALFTGNSFWLFASKLDHSGVILLNLARRESFFSVYGRAWGSILLMLVLVIVFLLIVAFLLTRYVTRPLNILTGVVQQIGDNTYTDRVEFSSSDEVGQLCSSINSMYDTIQEQIEQIKKEETMKFITEIRLLTEQINPHFLYNTLECIQDEVARGEAETASNMIQYLAEYLRIGLSYGDNMITVANELTHVYSYIRIMNQRFAQSIRFMYQVEPGLDRQYVLKTILQPLAENSIKHGFSIDSSGFPIASPTIEVNVFRSGDKLGIEIADNGSGFDVENTEQILYHNGSDGRERHVGLYNIYYRMITYYGAENVSFTLSSIPYYRNSITMTFPFTVRKEPNDQAGI